MSEFTARRPNVQSTNYHTTSGVPDADGQNALCELKAERRWATHHAKNPAPAKSNDPTTWATYEAATRFTTDVGVMLGAVDGGRRLAGFDLDHCRNPDTGAIIKNWAADIIERAHSYTEASYSGTGVRILFWDGTLPAGARNKRAMPGGGAVEAYDHDRFLTVTGNVIADYGLRAIADDELAALHAYIFGDQALKPEASDALDGTSLLSDADVLTWARNRPKFAALYDRGDLSAYASESDADAGLCSPLMEGCSNDRLQVRRLFEGSALYLAKDAKHREKWERADYRERTMTFAQFVPDADNVVPLRPEPVDDDDETSPLPDFPTHLLPTAAWALVETESERLGQPSGMLALSVLVALGAAIGAARRVYTDDRSHPAALWGAIVAGSGAGKSPAMDVALKPFREAARERARDVQRDWEDLKKWRADSSKDKGPAPYVRPLMLTTDMTTEGLAEQLSNSPRGLLIDLDELSAWANAMDAYRSGGRGPDRGRFCKMWSGAGDTIVRKGQEPLVVEDPLLSLLGGIQPTVLTSLNSIPDGLAPRFLYVDGTGFEEQYPTRKQADVALLAAWCRTVQSLLRLEAGANGPVVLRMTPEAVTAWHNGRQRRVDAQREFGEPEIYRKFDAYSARLSLVLTLAADADATTVQAPAVEAAWSMCLDYFAPHALSVLAGTAARDDSPEARLARFVATRGGELSLRDIVRGFEARYRTTEAAQALLSRAVARRLLKTEMRPDGQGRPRAWAVVR